MRRVQSDQVPGEIAQLVPVLVTGEVIQEVGHAGPVQRRVYTGRNAVWHAVPNALYAFQRAAGDRHEERPGGGEWGLAPTSRRSGHRCPACDGIASTVVGAGNVFF